MKSPHVFGRAFSGFTRRFPVVSVNKEPKFIPKLSSINGFCRISDSIRLENFMRQPPQQIIYQMQTQRQNLTTELNDELQLKLDSTQTLEHTMNLLSPTLSGSETLQGLLTLFLI